jgi:nucleotide-binding universal stress UspA family protein
MTPAEGTHPVIVVGVDGSEPAVGALRWAAAQAELTGSILRVVTTWEWAQSYGWALPYPADFDPVAEARSVVEEAVDEAREAHPGVAVKTAVVEGHPASVLVEESRGADLLVVGSRGHGEFSGMLLGSVSFHCVANAHCPVLVHRAPARDRRRAD